MVVKCYRMEKNIQLSFNIGMSLCGIMCNEWRILYRPLNVKIDFAENIVKAICVLHNYVRVRDGFNYEDTLNTLCNTIVKS